LRGLKAQLKNRSTLLGDGVSRAFLRALVILIGGYRDALKFHQGQEITFCRTSFIESRPPSMQPFLHKMLQLQIFQQVLCLVSVVNWSLMMVDHVLFVCPVFWAFPTFKVLSNSRFKFLPFGFVSVLKNA
jgi:hypothetical protein